MTVALPGYCVTDSHPALNYRNKLVIMVEIALFGYVKALFLYKSRKITSIFMDKQILRLKAKNKRTLV